MQNLVHQIQDLSGKPLGQLQSVLKNAEQSLQQAAQQHQGTSVIQAIQNLDPQQHTLGCVYLLNALGALTVPANGSDQFISLAITLIGGGDARQFQHAPQQTVVLAGALRDHLLAAQNPRRGILPLRQLIQKLAPSTEFITPVHAMLFQCALLAKHPAAAVPVLEQEVFDVDPSKTGMTPRDFLLYCYYGGLIRIARKQYPEALESLLTALTAPTMVTNAITVACWKKWALISLIHDGKIPQLPKWTPVAVTRMVKMEGAAYQDLAVAYSGKSQTVMVETVARHQAEFTQEENMGLVKLVLESQTKRNVQRLTQTYLTLSLPDIAAAVGLASAADAELAILRMIDAKEVFAEIHAEKGMVRFLEDPEQFRGSATLERIDAAMSRATSLADRLAATEHQVSRDKAYLGKLHMKDRHSWTEEHSGFGGMSEPPAPAMQLY